MYDLCLCDVALAPSTTTRGTTFAVHKKSELQLRVKTVLILFFLVLILSSSSPSLELLQNR